MMPKFILLRSHPRNFAISRGMGMKEGDSAGALGTATLGKTENTINEIDL